jgi:hypothetical protein
MSSLFPGLDSLVGLAQHGVDVKPTLLRVLTDLYVQKPTHTADEERQYVELSLRLIDAVDAATRDIVARRLAAYPGAPEKILARLDGRPETPATEAAEDDTAETRAEAAARAEAKAFIRDFFNAEADGRRAMLQTLDRAGALEGDGWATPSEDVARRLETSVLAGRPGDFVRELERALGVSRTLAQRIVNDLGGEPLVVAARALSVPTATLQRILLFVNPAIGHSPPGASPSRPNACARRRRRRVAPAWCAAGSAPPSRTGWPATTAAVSTARVRAASGRLPARLPSPAQRTTRSRKWRPDGSSISITQTSGSNRLSRAMKASAALSGAGLSPSTGTKARSNGLASSNSVCGAGP